jgi:hypothetical protein
VLNSNQRYAPATSRVLAAAVTACLAVPSWAAEPGTSLTAAAMRATPRVAQAEPGFRPFTSISAGYDSNVFRLDDEAPDIGERDDQSLVFALGIDGNVQSGQQRFDIDGEINYSMYGNHDDLDHTGGRLDAIWHFTAAGAARGDVGYRFSRRLRDFANQNPFNKVVDLRNEHSLFGDGDIDLPGSLRLNLRAGATDLSYSETETLDVRRYTVGTALEYVSAADNVVGIDAAFIQGDYENNSNANFDEYSVGPTFEWQASPRLRLDGKLAYTKRDNESELRKDYDGITGYVDMTVGQGEVTTLTASLYRDLNNLADETADYAEVDGIRIAPTWTWKEGLIDLRLLAGYEERNFKSTEDFAERKDDVVMAGVFVDWNPRRSITVTLGVDSERRSSTRELQDYDFLRVQLGIVARL